MTKAKQKITTATINNKQKTKQIFNNYGY